MEWKGGGRQEDVAWRDHRRVQVWMKEDGKKCWKM